MENEQFNKVELDLVKNHLSKKSVAIIAILAFVIYTSGIVVGGIILNKIHRDTNIQNHRCFSNDNDLTELIESNPVNKASSSTIVNEQDRVDISTDKSVFEDVAEPIGDQNKIELPPITPESADKDEID